MIIETARGTFRTHFAGGGQPRVLALHPLALSGAVWDGAGNGADERLGLMGLDARGHGGSSWDGQPFTVEDMADDAAAVIEAAATGPVGVIGLSMGGSTALVLAARRPDLVSKIVLADASACYGPGRVERWEERAQSAEFTPRDQQLGFQVDRWFGPSFRQEHPETVQRFCDLFVRTNGAAHAAACRALGSLDATDRLGKVTAPALVMVGSEDYATPPAMARDIAGGIAGADLVVIEGARHVSLLERPSAWARIEAHLGAN
jgi:3-oxoadipate enol-lactonase